MHKKIQVFKICLHINGNTENQLQYKANTAHLCPQSLGLKSHFGFKLSLLSALPPSLYAPPFTPMHLLLQPHYFWMKCCQGFQLTWCLILSLLNSEILSPVSKLLYYKFLPVKEFFHGSEILSFASKLPYLSDLLVCPNIIHFAVYHCTVDLNY